jgi:hypothetical protein
MGSVSVAGIAFCILRGPGVILGSWPSVAYAVTATNDTISTATMVKIANPSKHQPSFFFIFSSSKYESSTIFRLVGLMIYQPFLSVKCNQVLL